MIASLLPVPMATPGPLAAPSDVLDAPAGFADLLAVDGAPVPAPGQAAWPLPLPAAVPAAAGDAEGAVSATVGIVAPAIDEAAPAPAPIPIAAPIAAQIPGPIPGPMPARTGAPTPAGTPIATPDLPADGSVRDDAIPDLARPSLRQPSAPADRTVRRQAAASPDETPVPAHQASIEPAATVIATAPPAGFVRSGRADATDPAMLAAPEEQPGPMARTSGGTAARKLLRFASRTADDATRNDPADLAAASAVPTPVAPPAATPPRDTAAPEAVATSTPPALAPAPPGQAQAAAAPPSGQPAPTSPAPPNRPAVAIDAHGAGRPRVATIDAADRPAAPATATGETSAAPAGFATLVPGTTRAAPATAPPPVAQATRIGHDTGVAIARHISAGGAEKLTIRIARAELGRIEVRLSFDDAGTLRAVVAADNPASLDLLRRDQAELGRALGEAGVRADGASLRFDMQGGTGQGGDPGQGHAPGGRRTPFTGGYAATPAPDAPATDPRPLTPRGRIDLMA